MDHAVTSITDEMTNGCVINHGRGLLPIADNQPPIYCCPLNTWKRLEIRYGISDARCMSAGFIRVSSRLGTVSFPAVFVTVYSIRDFQLHEMYNSGDVVNCPGVALADVALEIIFGRRLLVKSRI